MTAAISLCSGYGGLDMAVEQVYGAHTVAVADIDRDAAAVLAHRFPGIPNLGDLRAVDWTGWTADIITAGYPCQPFSQAGLRKGEHDPRHLWPEVLRAIRLVRPRYAVLENVRGHLVLGFDRVLADLADAGFDAEWVVLRASDVGAAHARARLFVLAANTDGEPARRDGGTDARAEGAHGGRATVNGDRPADGCRAATHATSANGQRTELPPMVEAVGPAAEPGERYSSTGTDWQQFAPAVDRWERILGRAAPVPLIGKQLNARFVEWMMGLPDGWVTDLVPNRRALHTLGNGVVPQQAAAALQILRAAA